VKKTGGQTPRSLEGESLEEFLAEHFPPGLDYAYEPSLASHDPLISVG
jgi:hypothetical protein